MQLDAETTKAVVVVVEGLFDDLGNQRGEAAYARCATDEDCVMFGSAATDIDRAMTPDAIRAHLAYYTSGPVTISSTTRFHRVSGCGDVAWYSGEAEVRIDNKDPPILYRSTCVLERRNGIWLIVQFHGSEPR